MFIVFVFGFCNSKASTQTTRFCTCNYSTLDSYASNKQLPTLVTLRKARRAKIQSRKIHGDSKCVSNFWRSFEATWQKLKTRIPEETSRLFTGRATDGKVKPAFSVNKFTAFDEGHPTVVTFEKLDTCVPVSNSLKASSLPWCNYISTCVIRS